MLKMDLEYSKGILFVRLDGNLTKLTSYKINNYLVPVLLKHHIKYVVYNLYKLTSIDNDGVNALLNTKLAVKKYNGLIYICEANKEICKKIKKIHIKNCDNEISAYKMVEV